METVSIVFLATVFFNTRFPLGSGINGNGLDWGWGWGWGLDPLPSGKWNQWKLYALLQPILLYVGDPLPSGKWNQWKLYTAVICSKEQLPASLWEVESMET